MLCTQLFATFGSAFHYPDKDQNFTIWDTKQQEFRPAYRVEPSSPNETSCGCHSRHREDSNSVADITIDLGRMKIVEVSTDDTTARIGGGATTITRVRKNYKKRFCSPSITSPVQGYLSDWP
ncbi:hypothetical protein N7508_006256 [Penicillium antarcticum]|uniref:uncharacterized protein n=1 Tax=Penicillium antarcticum TaxID=416450 RepID=UPI00238F5C9F|nr:uncharacterized protein N7508_006256 [Penicillium antarcticum]KAJ5301393.1 hypothetical protein N7508_006256 [Penicillium antarcticum]